MCNARLGGLRMSLLLPLSISQALRPMVSYKGIARILSLAGGVLYLLGTPAGIRGGVRGGGASLPPLVCFASARHFW